jgi:hypothetical protein
MHRSTIRVAVLSTILLFVRASVAVDSGGNYVTRGIGAAEASCGDYIGTDAETKRSYESWLLGYISGVNHYRAGKPDFTNHAEVEGLNQWMENYCREHPLDPYSDAADALLSELKRRH